MKLSCGLVNLPIAVWLILSGSLLVNTTPLSGDNVSLVTRDQLPVSPSLIEEFRLWARFARQACFCQCKYRFGRGSKTRQPLSIMLSSAAYCNLNEWNCGAVCEGRTEGTEVIRFVRVEEPFPSRGYVAVNHRLKAVIAAFRGTSDIESFFINLQFIQVPFSKVTGAKIHIGYDILHKTTATQLTPLVIELAQKYPDYRVISTGHSLGGSNALLEALELVDLGIGKERLSVYVYGMLRLGNKEFAEYVNSLVDQGYGIYRIVRTNDFAPHLPPRAFDYLHSRPEYWITESGDVVQCPEAEDPTCSNSALPNVSILTHFNYFNTTMLPTCGLLFD